MADHPCYGTRCRICTPDRPCPATKAWLEADRIELSKAHGLDLARERARRRHSPQPRRFALMLTDRFGEYHEVSPMEEDRWL